MGSEIWAVVPVKRTDQAKQRLSAALGPEQRQALAFRMLQDVLSALTGCAALSGIAVVTEDAAVAAYARREGCRILADGATTGHTGAVMSAARRLAAEGCRRMLTLPGDIPLVTAAEVEAVAASQRDLPIGASAFTIVPAHDARGSNAILLSPPDRLPLRFGDDSFHPHCVMAAANGVDPIVLPLPGIACDIDTPADLARFLAIPSATRTRAFLIALAHSAEQAASMSAGS